MWVIKADVLSLTGLYSKYLGFTGIATGKIVIIGMTEDDLYSSEDIDTILDKINGLCSKYKFNDFSVTATDSSSKEVIVYGCRK